MNATALRILLWYLALGPDAEIRWESRVASLPIEHADAAPVSRAGLRATAELRPVSSGYRRTFRILGTGRVGDSTVALSLRIRQDAGEVPRLGRWITLGWHGLTASAGQLAGRAGSGLLVGQPGWGSAGGLRPAWSGAGGVLRSGVADVERTPRVVLIDTGAGRSARVFHLLEAGGGGPIGAQIPVGAGGLVLLAGRGWGGIEVTLGRRTGPVGWRLAAAGWRDPSGGDGGAAEAAFSGKQGAADWSLTLWHAAGPTSGLGDRPGEATATYPTGGRAAFGVRHPSGIRIIGSLSSGWDRLPIPYNSRAETACEVRFQSLGIRWRLLLGRRSALTADPYYAAAETVTSWRRLEARAASADPLDWRAGLERRSEGGIPAHGLWLQTGLKAIALGGYVRAAAARLPVGSALWWQEPGPVGAWRLHRQGESGWRVLVGIYTIPEGWHLRLELDRSRVLRAWLAFRY